MNKKLIFGIVLGVVLIYLSIRGINLHDIVSDLKKIHLGYVSLSLVFILLMQFLRSYRWGVILEPIEKINQFTLFSVTCVGFLAIAAIPARIGELARPYLIAKKSSIKMSSALGTVIVERVLDGLSILTITIVVLFWRDLPPWMINSGIIFFIATALMITCIIGLIWRRETSVKIINRILQLLPGKLADKANTVIHHFIDGFQVITNLKILLYLLFLSVMIWLVDVAAIYVLLISFGFNLPILASFTVMIVLIAGIAIPTAPGFIGNWHYACILGLSLFGVAKTDALSFAIVYHFLSIAVVVALGVIFLPFNKFSVSEMKQQMSRSNSTDSSADQKII
jgi:glycosyltransferase 2 family protein